MAGLSRGVYVLLRLSWKGLLLLMAVGTGGVVEAFGDAIPQSKVVVPLLSLLLIAGSIWLLGMICFPVDWSVRNSLQRGYGWGFLAGFGLVGAWLVAAFNIVYFFILHVVEVASQGMSATLPESLFVLWGLVGVPYFVNYLVHVGWRDGKTQARERGKKTDHLLMLLEKVGGAGRAPRTTQRLWHDYPTPEQAQREMETLEEAVMACTLLGISERMQASRSRDHEVEG